MRHTTVSFAGSAASAAQFPEGGLPEVAFLGRSNVGKSSLLNALAGVRDLARVSSTPGRTRLVNFFRVGDAFYLADLPGYGYARVPEAERRGWERLASAYLVGRESLALCVFLVDVRHEPSEGDATLRAFLDDHGLPYVVAATKADKLGRGELVRRTRALAEGIGRHARAVIACSAVTGAGVGELWREVRDAARRREGAA
ncbi:MAG TPA: ribosome biogenesis GTP-binding protein YihA/YsxC [Solirubrobacterales bacterium]|nr:ribosome biogenesis GTP-binding protein YihA/YsxC [Solirubrobacterales bacterium]